MRFHESIVVVMTVLSAHSDVVHALPEYSESGTYGERLNGRAAGSSLSAAEDAPTVQLTRDTDVSDDKRGLEMPGDLDDRAVIPPLPESVANLKDWIEAVGVGALCVGSIGWAGHKIFLYFTTEQQRQAWIECLARGVHRSPQEVRNTITAVEHEGYELQEHLR